MLRMRSQESSAVRVGQQVYILSQVVATCEDACTSSEASHARGRAGATPGAGSDESGMRGRVARTRGTSGSSAARRLWSGFGVPGPHDHGYFISRLVESHFIHEVLHQYQAAAVAMFEHLGRACLGYR